MKVTWKVDNPDADALRYRVAFKREGQTQWRDALKADEVHTKTELDWETSALPEGKYRVRVEASDETGEPARPGAEARRCVWATATMVITLQSSTFNRDVTYQGGRG